MTDAFAPDARRELRSSIPGRLVEQATRWVLSARLAGEQRLRAGMSRSSARGDRGDVNGYVFVTLMTAGIVMVIWVVARDRLTTLFERAISSVTGP